MSAPAIVWMVAGLLTVAVVAAVLIALVRHVLLLVRTLGRFRDEVTPVAEEIAREGARASERTASLGERAARGRRGGR